MKLITRVRRRDDGWVTAVEWQRANPQTNAWQGEREIVDVDEVVAALLRDDKVGTLFQWADRETGQRLTDAIVPALRVVRDERGRESIGDLPEVAAGRRLQDLSSV